MPVNKGQIWRQHGQVMGAGSRSTTRRAVCPHRGSWEQEDDVLLEDGGHTLHMIKSPVRDAAGKILGLGAIATDITERKRAELRRTFSLCQAGGKHAR